MATLYVDLENGNDNYAGTSFAPLAQGTNGRITSTTFSSVGATFPNNGSLIGQYLSIFNGSIYAVYNITAWVSATSLTIAALSGGTALSNQTVDRQYFIGGRWGTTRSGALALRTLPGDVVRIMGSPNPTSLGINATWTSAKSSLQLTISTATNATPIAVTTGVDHGYITGDTVVIIGVNGNTAANGVWDIVVTGLRTFTLNGSTGNGAYTSGGGVNKRTSKCVKLASPLTQNIASTGPRTTAWVASANITTSLSTITKEYYFSDSIAIAAGFTAGLAAYWSTGALDLSGYQQISFWVRRTTGASWAAGQLQLRLCSDAAGATPVNSFNIPVIASNNNWFPFTVNLGANMGANINSIALYVITDFGASTLLLSNIIACKSSSADDSLSLTSLIGTNTTGDTWRPIQSINGTRVVLDGGVNSEPQSANGGYYGTSQTVLTWKRETIKLPSSTSPTLQINESGAENNPITFSGGWDRTNMATKTLQTWVDDSLNPTNTVLANGTAGSTNWIAIENIGIVRGAISFAVQHTSVNSLHWNVNLLAANCASSGGILFSSGSLGAGGFTTITCDAVVGASSTGISIQNGIGPFNCYFPYVASNQGDGATVSLTNSSVFRINSYNNNLSGIYVSGSYDSSYLDTCITADNGNFGINQLVRWQPVCLKNCQINDAQEFNPALSTVDSTYIVYSQNHDNVNNNHKIFGAGYMISAAIDQRYTNSGISWKFQPTATYIISGRPAILPLAKVACGANTLVTVKAWMRRDNAGLTMRLACKGGQIAGVTSDVTSSVVAVNAWEEETITFTPTEIGVVEITAEAFGGTTFSGWVDDLTISQA